MSDKAKSYFSQIACYTFLAMAVLDFANVYELSDKGWFLVTGFLMTYAGGRKLMQSVQTFRGNQP